MRLKDRKAVVTGAGSGIGRGIATLFAAEGAAVAVVESNGDSAQAVAAEITSAGGVALPFAVDVSDAKDTEATTEDIRQAWGGIDVLVTSAAVSPGGTVTETAEASWDDVFAVNVKGTFLWMRAVLPVMIAGGGGSIVTVASQLAIAGGRSNAAYVASKGAIISLTRSVALDYVACDIRANALVPGAVDTPMLRRSFARQPNPEATAARSRGRHPMDRFGTVEELARAALFLASDESSFTTGALLTADGGWLAG